MFKFATDSSTMDMIESGTDPVELGLHSSLVLEKKVLYEILEAQLQEHTGELELSVSAFLGPYRIHIRKIDRASYRILDNLALSLPYHIQVFRRKGRKPMLEASFRISLQIDLNLSDLWHPDLDFTYLGIEWFEKPILRILGIRFGIESLLEGVLSRRLPGILDQAEQKIKEQIAVKNLPAILLDIIPKPLPLPEDFPMYVYAIPDRLQVFQLRDEADTLLAGIKLRGSLRAETAAPQFSEKDLPFMELVPQEDLSPAALELNLWSPFREWVRIANHLLDTGLIPGSTGRIRVEELHSIRMALGKLEVEFTLGGLYKGRIRLTGTPVYDKANQWFWLRGPEIEALDGNIFKKALSGMISSMIVGKIEDKFLFRLRPILQKAAAEIHKQLAALELPIPAALRWTGNKIHLDRFEIEEEGIKVAAKLDGLLQLTSPEAKVLALPAPEPGSDS